MLWCSILGSFCASNYFVRISAYCSANCDKLRNVETTLTKLELRHERLALSETFPELYLRYTRVFASLHQQFDHSLVKVGTK